MAWYSRLYNSIRRKRVDRDIDRELSFHLAERIEDLTASGMNEAEARRTAKLQFGNYGLQRERTREASMLTWLETFATDIRFGFRGLSQYPGYALIAIVTLTAALGLNASAFTVIETLYIRPWPVPDARSVFVAFFIGSPGAPDAGMARGVPYPSFRLLSAQAQRSELTAFHSATGTLSMLAGEEGEWVSGVAAADTFFDITRLPLQRGAGFSAAAPNAGDVLVISDRLWRRAFGADPGVLGRVVYMDGIPATVVGIVAPGYDGIFLREVDFYKPFPDEAEWESEWRRMAPVQGDIRVDAESFVVDVIGRVRPEWTRREAQVELNGLYLSFSPQSNPQELMLSGTAPGGRPGQLRRDVPIVFAFLLGGCLLILLLACANVGNLQLARGVIRGHEIATRLALGAGRTRIVRQLLTENLLLTLMAGLGGLAIAWVLPAFVIRFDSMSSPLQFRPNLVVAGFSFLLCLVTVFAFGLGPALHLTRRAAAWSTRMKGMPGRTMERARSLLLAVQVAVSVVLLVSALLLVRGVMNVSGGLGYDFTDLAMGRILVPDSPGLLSAVRTGLDQAGFDQAAFSQHFITSSPTARAVLAVEDAPQAGSWTFLDHAISANYFTVMGVPLVSGRMFEEGLAVQEIVLNQAAQRLLPPGTGMGSGVLIDGELNRIVGIVQDALVSGIREVQPTVFRPLRENPSFIPTLVLRDGRADLQARVRSVMEAVHPRLQADMRPVASILASATRNTVAGASIAAAIGILGLALASVGVFGLFGYLVEERRREIGIRMALGATSREVVRAALGPALRATLGGLIVGLVFASGAGSLLRGYLYGLSPLDPWSYLAVTVIISAAALIATYMPARRAAQVDPIVALRHD